MAPKKKALTKKKKTLSQKVKYLHKRLGVKSKWAIDIGPTQLRSGARADGRRAMANSVKKSEVIQEIQDEDQLLLGSLNPVILNHIFGFLDLASLKNIRKVNRIWNDEASWTLAKQSWIHIRIYDHLQHMMLLPQYEREYKEAIDRNESRPDLQETIEGSRNPQRFFVNLVVNYDWLMVDEDGALDLLDTYGQYLRTLRILNISGSNDYRRHSFGVWDVDEVAEAASLTNRLLSGICTILNKCPNIKILQFVSDGDKEESGFDGAEPLEPWDYSEIDIPKDLNLTTVELEIDVSGSLAEFCLSLFKASPNFCKLRIKDNSDRDVETTTFFETLAGHPEIGKRFQEFSWMKPGEPRDEEDICNDLQLISRLEFSSELKILRLETTKDQQNHTSGCSLIRILKKVSGSLEYLELSGQYLLMSRKNEIIPGDLSIILATEDFPIMKELKVLKIHSENAYGFGSVSLLEKLPNLHTFWLNMEKYVNPRWSREPLQARPSSNIPRIDCFLRDLEVFKESPHINLKRLYLADRNLKDGNSLHGIVRGFPNLQCLYVGIEGRTEDLLQSDLNIEVAVGILSEMKNLKELSLYDNGKSSNPEVCRVLSRIKDFEKMENFNLNHRNGTTKLSLGPIINALADLKRSGQCSTSITLLGYKIVSNDKSKILKYAKENGLSFKIYGHPYLQDYPLIDGP